MKKSKTRGVLVGTIKEFNLKREDGVSGLKAYSMKKGKMTELPACSRYLKEDWQKPAMVITVNGDDIPVHLGYDVKELQFDNETDETKKDYSFSGLEALTTKYVMGETRVRLSVSLENGERVRKTDDDDFVWSENEPIKLVYSSISSSNVPDEDSTQVDVTGRIIDMRKESKDGEPTGNVFVTLGMVAGSKAEPFPFTTNLVMDKIYKYVEDGEEYEITSADFVNAFAVGDNVSVSTTIVSIAPKVVKAEKRGFGKGTIQSGGGKPTLEYHIVGANKLIPTDENTISEADWDKLAEEKKNITAIRVQNAITKANENAKKQGGNTTVKGSSATAVGQTPFGSSPFDDIPSGGDEIPFI